MLFQIRKLMAVTGGQFSSLFMGVFQAVGIDR